MWDPSFIWVLVLSSIIFYFPEQHLQFARGDLSIIVAIPRFFKKLFQVMGLHE